MTGEQRRGEENRCNVTCCCSCCCSSGSWMGREEELSSICTSIFFSTVTNTRSGPGETLLELTEAALLVIGTAGASGNGNGGVWSKLSTKRAAAAAVLSDTTHGVTSHHPSSSSLINSSSVSVMKEETTGVSE